MNSSSSGVVSWLGSPVVMSVFFLISLFVVPFLVLLSTTVEAAGVDHGQRQRPLPVLAQAFGQKLVVPQPDRLEALGHALFDFFD